MITAKELRGKMLHGMHLMKRNDPLVLFEIASRGKTYVEIGTYWGGSAIVAGLAGCEVHCIDPFRYQGTKPKHIRENWTHAGLDPGKLFIYEQYHPPWPAELGDRQFDIGLIDGEHKAPQPQVDWEGMVNRVTKYVLFHDIDSYQGIEAAFRAAAELPEWQIEALGLGIDHQYGVLRHL